MRLVVCREALVEDGERDSLALCRPGRRCRRARRGRPRVPDGARRRARSARRPVDRSPTPHRHRIGPPHRPPCAGQRTATRSPASALAARSTAGSSGEHPAAKRRSIAWRHRAWRADRGRFSLTACRRASCGNRSAPLACSRRSPRRSAPPSVRAVTPAEPPASRPRARKTPCSRGRPRRAPPDAPVRTALRDRGGASLRCGEGLYPARVCRPSGRRVPRRSRATGRSTDEAWRQHRAGPGDRRP